MPSALEGTGSACKRDAHSGWLGVLDHPGPAGEDVGRHLCAHRETVSLLAISEKRWRSLWGCCEKSRGEFLSVGPFTAGRHHPVQRELFILSPFEMSVETRGVFVSVVEWHWWVFFPCTCQLFFICFLKKGYVNAVLG